jgi:predicted naringenin-chalcone synthase
MHLDEQRYQPATIAATATAVPPHILTREDVKTYMRKVFDVGERRLDAMMMVIDNAHVHQRHSIFPIEYLVEPRPLAQTSREYQEHAVRLGRQAAQVCLVNARMTPRDVDMIIAILFILHEWLTKTTMRSGEYGLAAAFGPGFSAEVLLLQWN